MGVVDVSGSYWVEASDVVEHARVHTVALLDKELTDPKCGQRYSPCPNFG